MKVPVFPANIYVCLDEFSFKQALKDKNVTHKVEALDNGAMAETHAIPTADGKTMIALLLDMTCIDDLECTLIHESVHLVYRIFEYIGEETPGEETRAYLTEYVYKEIKKGIEEHGIGKRNRKILDQKNQAVIGALLQMAEHRDGSPRSDSDLKSKDPIRGTENGNGGSKSKANVRIRRVR